MSGPVGIRTRVRSSGGPYAIQAILRAQNEKERVFAGVRYSPAILCLLLRGRRRMKNLPFSVLGELGVSAASAGHTVLVDCHERAGSALGTELLCPGDGVSVDLVSVRLLDRCLGCLCFSCHSNHSSAGASAGASGLSASIPFLFRRYSLSNSSAASLLS